MFGGSGFERRAERKNMKIERTFGGLPPYEKFLKQNSIEILGILFIIIQDMCQAKAKTYKKVTTSGVANNLCTLYTVYRRRHYASRIARSLAGRVQAFNIYTFKFFFYI